MNNFVNTIKATERLTEYAKSTGVKLSIRDLKDILVIKLEKSTEKVIFERITRIFFWNENLSIKISPTNTFVRKIETGNYTRFYISKRKFEKISQLYKLLKELGGDPYKITISEDPRQLSFYYTLYGRPTFNAPELDKFQEIVNPRIQNHDSIRVFNYYSDCSMDIRLDK